MRLASLPDRYGAPPQVLRSRVPPTTLAPYRKTASVPKGRSPMRRMAPILGLSFLAACASAGNPSSDDGTRNFLSGDQLRATGAATVEEAVRELRPAWLTAGRENVSVNPRGARRIEVCAQSCELRGCVSSVQAVSAQTVIGPGRATRRSTSQPDSQEGEVPNRKRSWRCSCDHRHGVVGRATSTLRGSPSLALEAPPDPE